MPIPYDDTRVRRKLRLQVSGPPSGRSNPHKVRRGPVKPDTETIDPKHRVIVSDFVKVRSSADKLARELKLDGGQKWREKPWHVRYAESRDPIDRSVTSNARPDSPFKRAEQKRNAQPVVVVKKKRVT